MSPGFEGKEEEGREEKRAEERGTAVCREEKRVKQKRVG